MEQWEYKSVKFETTGFSGGILDLADFDSLLNQYGRDGWELVSPFTTNQSYGSTRYVIAVFKRKKYN